MASVTISQDRSMAIDPGVVVRTGYVDVFRIRLACRERMAVGDVDRAYQRQLQLGSTQAWPPPHGFWDGETFVIEDGRHAWVSAVMLGMSHIFVAWREVGA